MKWTTEKPTTPGWYWARWHFHEPPGRPEVVEIELYKDELRIMEWDNVKTNLDDCPFNEWAGPLEPPE